MVKSIDTNLFRIFGRIAFILVILVLVSAGMASAVTNVSSCGTTIDTSGTYLLNANISNYSSGTCITITVSDVIFDGQGNTLDCVDDAYAYGIYVYNDSITLTNVTVKNVVVTGWEYGIYYYNVDNGSITGNTANSNYRAGIHLESSSYNTIIGNTVNFNSDTGVLIENVVIGDSSNTVSDNTISGNYYGVYLFNEDLTVIEGNAITDNIWGVYLEASFDNLIYNNFFNNSDNFDFSGTVYANDWNTTRVSDTNIVGGSYLGGNFWAKPDGTGFSETCTDADSDGICDSAYMLAPGNMDYLPLTTTVVMTPMMLKNDTIIELEAAKTGDKKTDKEIDKAIKHILKSLNIDPKHPDRPWKKYPLWIDETHLDPKHGHKVFSEEKKAVKHLMKLCKCKGIVNMTLEYTGSGTVDIRVYDKDGTMIAEVLNASNGDTIFIDGSILTKGKLGSDTTVKIYDSMTGALLDTQKIHTSCSRPLDKGMIFKDLEVTDVSKIVYPQGGVCPASEIIEKIVQADEVLAKTAIDDAKNISVVDPKNQDKVDKEIAKAWEELAKAEDKLNESKPDKAIDHYKKAWKHAQHAIKHAEKIKKEK